MEREMCLKAGAKGGARRALGVNTASSRCKCVTVCFVLVKNEVKLELFHCASLQKVKKKKR